MGFPRMSRVLASVAVAAASIAIAVAGCGGGSGGGGDSAAAPVTDKASLDGKSFVATDVVGHELVPDTEITMNFEDGKISLSAGCNSMFGGYRLEDGRIKAPKLASTMMGCPDGRAEQDQWLAALLASGTGITADGDGLTLSEGEVTLTFEPR